MAISPGVRLGPYEISALLGKGAMGEVYLAHDTRLDRSVAVKVLPLESMRNAERVRRFEQEAKAASGRNHPNILTIYDFGVADGTYYMATEYVEGQTLHELIAAGRMGLIRALDIAIQCASGLATAHAAGIIHRDVKPHNIMVRPDGYVKILDFGLAKLAEKPLTASDPDALTAASGLTAPGLIIGTWLYMSPEQARGLELDARSDIWSLGVVLYEMVTGRSPFASPTMSDTLASILNREPESLSSCGVRAPEELKHILAKALAKDRDGRYHSIKDMELDMKQLRKELESGVSRSHHMGVVATEIKPEGAGKGHISAGISPGRKMSLLLVSGVLAAALLAWAVIAYRQSNVIPVPPGTPAAAVADRQLSYSLLVQRMRDGKPYETAFAATGREIFENGWKVQFDFSVPQAGSLYLLNDGPGPQGEQELSVVFPTPSVNNGSAQVMAYKNVQSGWLLFNNHAGREKFWVVWAVKPVRELEQSIQQAAQSRDPVIRDTQVTQAIRELLAKSPAASVSVDKDNKQTSLRGEGDVLVSELELEHQ